MAFRFRSWLAAAVPVAVLGGLGLLVWQGSDTPPASANIVGSVAGGSAWIPMELSGAEDIAGIPGWDVRRGNYRIGQLDGMRVLELGPEPMVEGKVLWTRAMRGGGGVRARMKGDRSRRSFPRFSIGLHQERELHLRAFPGERKVELVSCNPDLSGEVVLTSVPLPDWAWKPEDWTWLEFRIRPGGEGDAGGAGVGNSSNNPGAVNKTGSGTGNENGRVVCEGRVWRDGGQRPEKAQLIHSLNLPPTVFFAALQGAPFARKPIYLNAAETLPP